MISDMHTHTSFSSDSKADINLQIEKAIQLGMSHIAITDHHDIDYPPWHSTYLLENEDKYVETIQSLKDIYKGRINVILGVEIGIQTHIVDEINAFIKKFPFEFIIGSTHCFERKDTEDQSLYNFRSKEAAIYKYFETVFENISKFKNFDVVGHLDFVLRDIPGKNKGFSYNTYSDILDNILNEIIYSGRGIECNTKSLFVGMGEPSPDRSIIKRYKELGGEIITFGSDAHDSERIGCSFSIASEIVKECGFKYYTVYENRKPIFIKI